MMTCGSSNADGTRCGKPCYKKCQKCYEHAREKWKKRSDVYVIDVRRTWKVPKRRARKHKVTTSWNPHQRERLKIDMLRILPHDTANELENILESRNFRVWPKQCQELLLDCIDVLTGAPYADPPRREPTVADIHHVVATLTEMQGEWLKPNNKRIIDVGIERLSEI